MSDTPATIAAATSACMVATSVNPIMEIVPGLVFGCGNWQMIFAALVTIQGEMPLVSKDHENAHLGSKYASLDSVVKVIRPLLAKAGLGLLQPYRIEGNSLLLTTMIISRDNGAYIFSTCNGPIEKGTCQAVGSSITYNKRMHLSALLNAVAGEEDDDGAAATFESDDRAKIVSLATSTCHTAEKVLTADGVGRVLTEVLGVGKDGKRPPLYQADKGQLEAVIAALNEAIGVKTPATRKAG